MKPALSIGAISGHNSERSGPAVLEHPGPWPTT